MIQSFCEEMDSETETETANGKSLHQYICDNNGVILEQWCCNFVYQAVTEKQVIQMMLCDLADPEQQRRKNLLNKDVRQCAVFTTEHPKYDRLTCVAFCTAFYNQRY